MKIIVKKFGGTSVSTPEVREMVYEKILKDVDAGYKVVAVISAMGRRGAPYATDTLLDMFLAENPDTDQRELDFGAVCGEFLAGCLITAHLQKLGRKAIYLSAFQAGIRCNGVYGDARVTEVKTARLLKLLEDGYIPVIAGGQGATEDGEVCMLGRGGSDTTGTALGAALGAVQTEIYTDVTGVMTSDPRIITNAKLIRQMSYQNCIDMAYQGAKVMHPRAVETAAQLPSMGLYVRSTYSEDPGTLIGGASDESGIVGVALQENQLVVHGTVTPEFAALLATKEVAPQDVTGAGPLFAIPEKEVKRFESLSKVAGLSFSVAATADKISIIGDKLSTMPGLMDKCKKALSGAGVNVLFEHETDTYISVWVDKNGKDSANALHDLLIK